jgi:glycosyltransferase involved in cell wall biosynthesis
MHQLSSLAWEIGIVRMRGKEDLEVQFSGSFLSPVMMNPVYWLRGLFWALRHRKKELIELFEQVWKASATSKTKIKLFFLLFTVLGIAEFLESHKIFFDHIRAHFLHSEALSSYWLSTLVRVPYSITIHTKMIYYPSSLVEKIVRNASFCVGISNETVDLARRLRSTPNGVFLIHNGVEFVDLKNREKVISPIPVILAVGRLIPKKGFDVLIKACAFLANDNFDFICKIIGSGSEYGYLEKLIIENGLSRHVQLIGAVPFEDVVTHYQSATALIMPSRVCDDDVDGLPTVIIEALAMGIPVIASPIAGIPDLIKNKKTGLIVPPDDYKALAKAIVELLSDKNLRDSLALQGKREIADEFDISETIKKLNNVMTISLTKCN